MWDDEKYRAIVDAVKKSGRLEGCKVTTREDVYAFIGDKTGVTEEGAKSWARKKNTGPRTNEQIAKIEQLFSLPEGSLGRREEKAPKAKKVVIKMTDFNKHAVLCCYQAMKEYLHSDEVENEECLAAMGQYKIASMNSLIPLSMTNKKHSLSVTPMKSASGRTMVPGISGIKKVQ